MTRLFFLICYQKQFIGVHRTIEISLPNLIKAMQRVCQSDHRPSDNQPNGRVRMAVANNYYPSQVLRIFDINHRTLTHYGIIFKFKNNAQVVRSFFFNIKTSCFEALNICQAPSTRCTQFTNTSLQKSPRRGVHGALAVEGP